MILSLAAERERREPGIPKEGGPMTEAAEGGREAHPPSDDCFSLQPEDPVGGAASSLLSESAFDQTLLIFPYTETQERKKSEEKDWRQEASPLRRWR